MKRWFWLALLLAAFFHAVPLGAMVAWNLLHVKRTGPELEAAWGDSDRDGFPEIAAISDTPGTWKQGDDNTPGGDGVAEMPKEPQPEEKPAEIPPEPEQPPAVPMDPVPAVVIPEEKPAVTKTEPPPLKASAVKADQSIHQAVAMLKPGRPGGSNKPIGVPSAGGTKGVRTAPKRLDDRTPPYPKLAEMNGYEGRPRVWMLISATGRVTEVKLARSCGHKVLDDAAVRFAWTLRFRPAREGSIPVESDATQPFDFFLR